ncbi:MAG: hypothetical protein J2P15_22515, partial [Micromonosporaceae bacterium]|nr:hypothetical protein [Micromonosporaceae bacterium]
VADRYRQAQVANAGRYPKAAEVTTATGAVVGRVYLYQGSPSWVMVSLFGAPEPGRYAMTVQTADGTSYPAGSCVVTGHSATVGYPLPVSANQISAIDITRPGVRLSVRPNK